MNAIVIVILQQTSSWEWVTPTFQIPHAHIHWVLLLFPGAPPAILSSLARKIWAIVQESVVHFTGRGKSVEFALSRRAFRMNRLCDGEWRETFGWVVVDEVVSGWTSLDDLVVLVVLVVAHIILPRLNLLAPCCLCVIASLVASGGDERELFTFGFEVFGGELSRASVWRVFKACSTESAETNEIGDDVALGDICRESGGSCWSEACFCFSTRSWRKSLPSSLLDEWGCVTKNGWFVGNENNNWFFMPKSSSTWHVLIFFRTWYSIEGRFQLKTGERGGMSIWGARVSECARKRTRTECARHKSVTATHRQKYEKNKKRVRDTLLRFWSGFHLKCAFSVDEREKHTWHLRPWQAKETLRFNCWMHERI